ncbi:hypothetical protein SETIT_5G286800v2 [Setaria italica]|uniref:Pectinesterase inhibitor domain-containing protein n=1 Tax=Setaria italica TaxID=4555 RepID=K3XT43_SETIT|nr:uncharacterized protein LOC101766805 [Setaria italica]RCV26953.1 hypothetical protein SETIT_5G286800v2 [Setaria italica]
MFRFRDLAALILVAASAASLDSVGARVVHPIVNPPTAAAPAPASDGRRLFATAGRDELIALCQQMHYKTLCTTMAMLPGVSTPEQLLDTSLRITAVKAAMAAMKLDQAIKSGGGAEGEGMASSLQSCRESYASLVDSLNSTRDTLRSGGSSADLMSELSAAGTFSTDCEDIFDERPELKSPIPGAQRHISRLVSNCLDLASTIKEQP